MLADQEKLPLEVDVHHVKSLLDAGTEFLFIDCREPDEHETTRIEGTTLFPLSQMQERIAEIEQHRETHIIVHCHHGGRSMRVTQWLIKQEFLQVQNMAGGIDDWSLNIDDSVPRY